MPKEMTKEEAIKELSCIADEMPSMECGDWKEAICMGIKALKQEPILNKIIAEIEQMAKPNEIGGRENGKSIRYGLCMALEIIDKYRKEIED